jgi:hypothetical protein
MRKLLPLLLLASIGCPAKKKLPPPPPPPARCEFDLAGSGYFSAVGTGAAAKQIASSADLIGGDNAQGVTGDFLLQNDRIKVVIQRPTRYIAPIPYGGGIIDADLVRANGEPGRDQLGKIAPLYQFGRTPNVQTVEVINDGSMGGYAVVASTGTDAVDDYLNVNNVLTQYLGAGTMLVTSPEKELDLLITTYYVLSPGESRVRMLTAFCNNGNTAITTEVGDLTEQGGTSDFFNPQGCANGMGAHGCFADVAPWFGYQADQVAYGWRPMKTSEFKTPETDNSLIYVSGVVGTMIGGDGMTGLLEWLDPQAMTRHGSYGIPAGGTRQYLRDFHIGKDFGDITSQFIALDGSPKSRLDLTVTDDTNGMPAAGAHVAIVDSLTMKEVTLLVAAADGTAHVDLPPATYQVSAAVLGHGLIAPQNITLPSSGTMSATVHVGASQKLTVTAKDPNGGPLTAKVEVVCPGGPCANAPEKYRQYFDIDQTPSTLQLVGYIGATGTATFDVPVGQYQVSVTRGPEYSAFPDTFPLAGQTLDLTAGPQTVNAVLGHVVDTTGWMSADLHVHAVKSPDSSVPVISRVMSFAAEGVDVLVSTDHDFVFDFAPAIQALGMQSQMTSMIGCEVTPFDFGHQQAYPSTMAPGPIGGAVDWAGGDGPTLRLDQLYAALRTANPGVILQMNHPRGAIGGTLTQIQIDTDTGATHADPATFRQQPAAGASASDTKLFSLDFDAMELQNGVGARYDVMNDWMTFLSHGWVKTGTGVSDSHNLSTNTGGYGRTWVKLGVDAPADFSSDAFAAAMKKHHAVASSGPFITMTAQRLDTNMMPVGNAVDVGDTLSVNVAGGEKVQLTVDVQSPAWLTFDSIQVYTHAVGRDAHDGMSNTEWPDSRVLQKKTYDPTMFTLEPVPGLNGFNRIHVTEKFIVSPTADTWYVAMVTASTATHGLSPMAWGGVNCTNGVCTEKDTYPIGFTNPVLIDGDGSGAYDTPPLPVSQTLRSPKQKPVPARHVPTRSELEAAGKKALTHDHSMAAQ